MTKRYGPLSNELIERIRETYIQSDMTLEDISRRSEELFGQKVSIDVLKKRAGDDGDWSVLKAQYREENKSENLDDQIMDIMKVVYEDIMDKETPPSARAQLVNSFITLLNKGGGNKAKGTAKTSTEQAIEIGQKVFKELQSELEDDE